MIETSIVIHFQRLRVTLFLVSLLLPDFALAQQTNDSERIDFRTQVLPIFQDRCVECHSEENIEGNLNLLSRQSIEDGGFSGRPIIGSFANESELVLRISSENEEYRMPKSDDPLSADEIATISKWVQQGGIFEQAVKEQPDPTFTDHLANGWVAIEFASQRKPFRYAALFIAPLLVYYFFLGLQSYSRWRRSQKSDRLATAVSGRWASFRAFAYMTVIFSAAATIAYQQGRLEENDVETSELKSQLQSLSRNVVEEPSKPPFVPHPMHPPRLGGLYYRGNDERNDRLFNHGFYRTAELDLKLVDGSGKELRIGDAVNENELSIRLKIKRSSNAAQGMFDQRSMGSTFISTSFAGTESANDRQLLKPVKDGQEWAVVYPIGADKATIENVSTQASDIARKGDLYVYYGPLDSNRIHYSIHFDVSIKDGKIAEGSELWMGSTYNLSGRVLLPTEKDILLDRWFDFRPIPEIPDSREQNSSSKQGL